MATRLGQATQVPKIAGLYASWEYGYARVLTPMQALSSCAPGISWRDVDIATFEVGVNEAHDLYYVSAPLSAELPGFLRRLHQTGHPVVFDVPYPWTDAELQSVFPYVQGLVAANTALCQYLSTVTTRHMVFEVETYTNPSTWPVGGRYVLPAEMDALCIGIFNEPLYAHEDDYRVLVSVVEQVRAELGSLVFFVFFGDCPNFLRPLVDMVLEPHEISWYERGHFYGQLDIALFPHQSQAIDAYRVPLRLFEAGLSRTAVICSPEGQEPYVTRSCGAWAKNADHWADRLQRYIRSSQERYRVAVAFEVAAKRRDVYRHIPHLSRMWQAMYAQLTHQGVSFLVPQCA